MADSSRREKIRADQKKYSWFYALIIGVALLGAGVWIGASFFADKDGYAMNVVTELLGIGATVFIIDRIYSYRNREKDIESLKQTLVQDAGSGVNDIARNAIEQLRNNGWLEGDDGLLCGKHAKLNHANLNNARLDRVNLKETSLVGAELNSAHMIKAELQNAKLSFAKMHCAIAFGAQFQDSDLCNAKFIEADLSYAQFQNAKLSKVSLEEAFMTKANLQNADLTEANMKKARLLGDVNLQGANLRDADLEGAFIGDANLRGANLCGSNIHEAYLYEIILPNGDPYAHDRDLDKFTDPEDSEFAETLKEINDIRKEMGYKAIVSS